MPEENGLLNANYIAYDKDNDGSKLALEEDQILNLVAKIQDRFRDAKDSRTAHEHRMIKAYDNYRGVYGKHVRFRESEKSRVFVKITKTKVLAAYGQLIDIIFGGTAFPIGIRETDMPEGTDEYRHLSANSPEQLQGVTEGDEPSDEEDNPYDVGFEGDGKVLKPGATFGNFKKMLGIGKDRSQKDEVLQVGPTNVPGEPQESTAKDAARQMEKIIHDQLEESSAIMELSKCFFEGVLLGTGIVKGPFNHNKVLNCWVKNEDGKREHKPKFVRSPRIEFVSVWDFYPDPNATCMQECDYVVHRHRFNRSQVRNLQKQPLFDKEAINATLKDGPNYVKESYENILKNAEEGSGKDQSDRYEVLEYWGVMDAKDVEEIGIKLPKDTDNLSEIQINAWVCGKRLLRAAVNPFVPARIPYQAFSYEKNPYSFFGIGVPENMEDSQDVINANARMAIDNLAISSNVIFDVDEAAMVDGQDFKLYPGKVFRRQAGVPGQAIYGIQIPNTTQQSVMMLDKFRQLADESTGLPSYSHGQTGVQSMTRTASGMSMLLGAASLNIKTVVKTIDNELLQPLGEAYFNWNMQFYEGDLLDGIDLEVNALGTSSIMQKEVRSQRLTMLLQTVLNPAIAPFIKMPTLIKELAHSLDLDPDELINNPDEAAIAAAIIGAQNVQGIGPGSPGSSEQQASMGSPDALPGPGGSAGITGTGNGTIGTGIVPMAGEEGFSG